METEIKLLRPGDEALLDKIDPYVFDDPIHAESARAFLYDPRHHLVVAIEAGTVVGFISAVHYVHPDKPRPELWLNEVSVAASHQRRGVGRAMMRVMLAVGRSLGCSEAWVLTERDNTAAMRLYASQGGAEHEPDAVMFTFRLSAGNEK